MMFCTLKEKKEMQGEWIETRHGRGFYAGPELSSACSLKTRSRAGREAYHNVSRPRRACPILSKPLLHGLDTLWCVRTASIGRGRRWTGAADGGRQAYEQYSRIGKKNDGDRLGRLRWNRAGGISSCKGSPLFSGAFEDGPRKKGRGFVRLNIPPALFH